ncbi:MAG: hypothetical protein Q4F83_04970 [Eubacteriales bacterium]|nr:hypothetical protein [Eubacteriales bacterium]
MSYVIINGNRYDIPEMNFDAVCELEEAGVNILGADRSNMKLATMARGLTAWIMGVDVQTASKELEAHIANGGNIVDIISRTTEAMQKSGFFAQNRQKQPQDHKVKQYPGKNQQYQGNRAQRRANDKNRGNGNRSQR